jgi:hypothetical protein
MLELIVGSLLPDGHVDGEILGDWDGTPVGVPDGLAVGSPRPYGLVDGQILLTG